MRTIVSIAFILTSLFSSGQNKKENVIPDNCDTCIYDLVAIQNAPEFPGGDKGLIKFLSTNTKFPNAAKDLGLEGKVFVSFIINEEGEITKIELFKGVKVPETIKGKKIKRKFHKKYQEAADEINKEAIRVVKAMPKWKPGMQNDKLVKVKFILPFVFKIT